MNKSCFSLDLAPSNLPSMPNAFSADKNYTQSMMMPLPCFTVDMLCSRECERIVFCYITAKGTRTVFLLTTALFLALVFKN